MNRIVTWGWALAATRALGLRKQELEPGHAPLAEDGPCCRGSCRELQPRCWRRAPWRGRTRQSARGQPVDSPAATAMQQGPAPLRPSAMSSRAFPDTSACPPIPPRGPLHLSLGGIQHHDDDVSCACHSNHLPATAFPLCCAFNDSRKVQELDVGSFVFNDPWDTRQGCELIGCSFTGCGGH